MSESSSPVAIAQGVDPRYIGAKLIIHLDVTALIHGDSRVLQTEVLGVRHPADCEQHMGANACSIVGAAIDIDGHLVAAVFQGDAFSAQPNFDAFVFDDCLDGFGNVFVFTLNQPRSHLYNRDLTAKAAVHLSKLQTHIAAANDDQMPGQKVHAHHG